MLFARRRSVFRLLSCVCIWISATKQALKVAVSAPNRVDGLDKLIEACFAALQILRYISLDLQV